MGVRLYKRLRTIIFNRKNINYGNDGPVNNKNLFTTYLQGHPGLYWAYNEHRSCTEKVQLLNFVIRWILFSATIFSNPVQCSLAPPQTGICQVAQWKSDTKCLD